MYMIFVYIEFLVNRLLQLK